MSNRISSPSTSSLQSTTPSVSSTTPLRASTSRKDYSAAFGSLQSMYGMGVAQSGQLASSLPPAPKLRTKAPLQSSPIVHSSAPPSTTPQSRSATAVQKHYFAAFGSLQSTYGIGVEGSRPLSTSSPTPEKSSPQSSLSSCLSTPSSSPAESTQKASALSSTSLKDYEAAFGALSSSQAIPQQLSLRSGNRPL